MNPLEARRPASPHTSLPERKEEENVKRQGVCDRFPRDSEGHSGTTHAAR